MPIMTAELRVYIRRQIDAISRERISEENVAFCMVCFEPYDKIRSTSKRTSRKLCGCTTQGMGHQRPVRSVEEKREVRRRYRARRKAASPVVA